VAGAYYEIVIRGRLNGPLAHWAHELEIRSSEPDGTHVSGWFADQAALQGLITQLGDLGLELSSVRQLPKPD
jgi:hypothetical protein